MPINDLSGKFCFLIFVSSLIWKAMLLIARLSLYCRFIHLHKK